MIAEIEDAPVSISLPASNLAARFRRECYLSLSFLFSLSLSVSLVLESNLARLLFAQGEYYEGPSRSPRCRRRCEEQPAAGVVESRDSVMSTNVASGSDRRVPRRRG